MTENQRKFPRTEIQLEVELNTAEGSSRTCMTKDVSQGGMYILLKNTEDHPLGEIVSLQYKNPLDNYAETSKDAIIVRCNDDGIAVAFVEMEEF